MQASAEPGSTFGRVAGTYARTRPPYPRELVERAAFLLGIGPDATVLDLASGTGNLTRTLRAVFADVFAVEPDAAMRAEFPGEVVAGSAEAIPLPDGSVDAVFVGEAFHWFDAPRAMREIRRVARGLAVLSRSWGISEQPELLPAPFREDLDRVWARFHPPREIDDFPDWRGAIDPDGEEQFVQHVPISGRDLVDLHMTGSTLTAIDEGEREEIAQRAYPLVAELYDLRVVTTLHWKRFA